MSSLTPEEFHQLDAFQEILLERIGMLERRFDRLSLNIVRQLEAFIQLHGLLGPIPAPLHGWSISADLALELVRLIQKDPPDLVVEFGSGVSTFVLLAALEQVRSPDHRSLNKHGGLIRLVCFEHLQDCHQATADLLRASPIRSEVDLRLSSLEPWKDATGSYSFYGGVEVIGEYLTPFSRLKDPVRLLVLVDGPPGSTNPRARYPAFPLLVEQLERLSGQGPPLCVDLLLDDFERRDERALATAWEAQLNQRQLPYRRWERATENGTLHLRWQTHL